MDLRRLSPLDESFLTLETPSAHMHVGWVAVLEPPTQGPSPSFAQLRDHIGARLPRAPRYRQVLRAAPWGLGAAAWIDDEDFDLARHVVNTDSTRLDEVIAATMSTPLRRDRPLWQICIADRLEDGRVGVVGRAHHCMVDGLAAVELASLLLDPTPLPGDPADEEWKPVPGPGSTDLVAGAIADLARLQGDLLGLAARAATSPRRALEMTERTLRSAGALLGATRPAEPDATLNPEISPRRLLGRVARPLDELLEVKDVFGVKLNDVVLSVSAGAIRRLLRERGSQPAAQKTMVPVSVRGDESAGELGNRISFMFIELPCDEPDPVRRLRRIHAETTDRKRAGEPEGAGDVVRALGLAPPPLRKLASRLLASPRVFNLVVSNIPGPREPLYMRGCRLVEAYPVVPLAERHSLSIGMTTVSDGAFFGLYADPQTLPEVHELAVAIDDSINELLVAARSVRAEAPLVAA